MVGICKVMIKCNILGLNYFFFVIVVEVNVFVIF